MYNCHVVTASAADERVLSYQHSTEIDKIDHKRVKCSVIYPNIQQVSEMTPHVDRGKLQGGK